MNSWTQIPIEALFGSIGALVLILYGDLRWTLRKLTADGVKRGRQLAVFRIYLSQLCAKAGIHFEGEPNGNGD